jgi:hypothetical protein
VILPHLLLEESKVTTSKWPGPFLLSFFHVYLTRSHIVRRKISASLDISSLNNQLAQFNIGFMVLHINTAY